ncbi:MAG: tRNA (guanine6-N2)-methyltransferase [Patescibacteria group bacterium]|nr:tRNA (guanine6-N2)-methyltransferase [Patescibacteria group bacterium]
MDKINYQLKLGFAEGLGCVVEEEIKLKLKNPILSKEKDCFYLDFEESFLDVLKLKSVGIVSLVLRGDNYNPRYLSKHKSILGDMVNLVINKSLDKFKTFKLSCAGYDSDEVKSLLEYIKVEFNINEKSEADLKINIYKVNYSWEISIQVTKRPLSLRDYRAVNMSGAMDSNIAYSLNLLCNLSDKKSYLNAFSGSSTLLIEAALEYSNLETVAGFDINKKHLSSGYQNIKKAGLIKKIKLSESDIFHLREWGKFDVIVADLPFGMTIL